MSEWNKPPEKTTMFLGNGMEHFLQYESYKAGFIAGQKKLLEHLIAYWGEKDEFVIVAHFRYLLKQLEVKP